MNRRAEALRARLVANAMIASGCMIATGVVGGPLVRVWRWMVFPLAGLFLTALLFTWRASRLWKRWTAELDDETPGQSRPD